MEFIKLNIQLFGAFAEETSTTTSTSGSNKGTLYASLTENSTSTTNNTSSITAYCKFTQNTGSFAAYYTPKLQLWWYDNKDYKDGIKLGEEEVTQLNYGSTGKTVEIKVTKDISHLDDGTLKGRVESKWIWTGGGYACKSVDAITDDTSLTTIPRAKTITALSADIGYDTTITLKQTSASYTATIEWECGELSGVIADKTKEISIGWKIPTDIYSQMLPTDKEKSITLKATTFNGDTQVGSTQTTTIKAKVNMEDNKPFAYLSVMDTNEKTLELTNDENKVILNASNILANFTGMTRNGATIKSITINGMGVSYSPQEIDGSDIPQDVTEIVAGSYQFEKATTNKFTLVVTDSRDNTNVISTDNEITLDKIDYIVPTISNSTLFKRNAPTDGKVNLKYEGSFFNGSFQDAVPNNLEMAYAYKEKKDDEFGGWITLTPTIIQGQNSFKGEMQLAEEFDYDKIYTLKVSVKDALTELGDVYYIQDVSRGKPSHWYDDENFYVEGNYYQRNKETGKWFKPIGNLSSLKTNEKSSIVTAVNELSEKNILTASLKSHYYIKTTDTYEILPLSLYSQLGNKLTLNNDGSVTIGAGVKYIKLGASTRHRSGAVGVKYMTAYRNNEAIIQISQQRTATTGFFSLSGNGGLIPVEQGDIITLQVYGTADDIIGGSNPLVTYMTIEGIT